MEHRSTHPIQGSTANEVIARATIEIQRGRGILYVYATDGTPLLKITGLPTPVPPLANGRDSVRQLLIDIGQAGAVCEWSPTPVAVKGSNPIPDDQDLWCDKRTDATRLLQSAGATIPRKRTGE